ncbi:hypothetical protein [Shewanella oncorhynchi]|jgi:hypothetical protein|uniref:hypothetical protein n=1 Tax=Shewanella oncorhynchi TaxID=2726434 RepID=UPI003D78DEFF
MYKDYSLGVLAKQFQSQLTELELNVIKALLDVTRSFFKQSDLFVVTNKDEGKPVIRIGAERKRLKNKTNNRVVLSIGSPKNGNRPILAWGGQGTKKPKVLKSKIYQLDGVEDVFGTMQGIELDKIDKAAIKRYKSFLEVNRQHPLLHRYFEGSSISDLSFEDSPQGNDKDGVHSSSSPEFSTRQLSGEQVIARLDEVSLLQKPLMEYLKNHKALREHVVFKEEPTAVGNMDLFILPIKRTMKSPLAILELKAIKSEDGERGLNQTKIRHSYGQLLDYSVNLKQPVLFEKVERWLVVKHIPLECLNLLEQLTKFDSNFSVWTYNESDEVPLKRQIGKSHSFAFL